METWGLSGSLGLLGQGPYPPDAQTLLFNVVYQTEDIVRVRIFDPSDDQRWNVPESLVQVQSPPEQPPETRGYNITWTSSPFGFAVIRTADNEVLFNSTSPLTTFNATSAAQSRNDAATSLEQSLLLSSERLGRQMEGAKGRRQSQVAGEATGKHVGEGPIAFNGILFEEQYIEFSTQIPSSPAIYGLGERSEHLLLDANDKHYPIFNRDQGWAKVLLDVPVSRILFQ